LKLDSTLLPSIGDCITPFQNVILHHVALSDKPGSIILETSDRFMAGGFPDERRKMRWLEDPLVERRGEPEGSVKAFPFDELAKRESIEPDVVKVDVHGAEGNVIKGMKNSLRRSVSHIYCELHQEMTDGYSARDVIHALQDAGLETFEFSGFRTERGHLVSILDDPTLPPGGIMVYGRK
jgi:FkbM family methyltransferase